MQRMTAATEQSEEENKPLPLAFDPDRVCIPEQLVTFIFLKNSEQKKYGKLMANLKEQYA